jgi:hypothetical protein
LNQKIAFARMHFRENTYIFYVTSVLEENIMMEILMYPIVAIMALLGGGSSLIVVAYLFIVLAQKIKNKIKYGASLYD